MTDLDRFLVAQNRPPTDSTWDCHFDNMYRQAMHELHLGQKTTHWMWFIFPQAYGLSVSMRGQFYGLKSMDEARDYHLHPVLGLRYRLSCDAVDRALRTGRSLVDVFGGIDAEKYQSSFSLFTTCFQGSQEIFR
jgi:uncharacterized protein (DUF1810 family)